MDIQISRWIVETFGSSKAFAVISKIFTFGGNKWFIIGVVALLLIFKKTRKMGITALFACAITFLFNDFLLKNWIARERPFIVDSSLTQMCELAGYPLPDGYSMTSGHAAVSMALAISIMMHSWKLGLPAMAYSILVGLSRVCLCVHFLTDVLAGFVLGTVIAILVYFAIVLVKKLYQKRKEKKNENTSSSVGEQA